MGEVSEGWVGPQTMGGNLGSWHPGSFQLLLARPSLTQEQLGPYLNLQGVQLSPCED